MDLCVCACLSTCICTSDLYAFRSTQAVGHRRNRSLRSPFCLVPRLSLRPRATPLSVCTLLSISIHLLNILSIPRIYRVYVWVGHAPLILPSVRSAILFFLFFFVCSSALSFFLSSAVYVLSRSYIGTKVQVEDFLNEVYLCLKALKNHIPDHREEVRRTVSHLQKSWGATALVFSGEERARDETIKTRGPHSSRPPEQR